MIGTVIYTDASPLSPSYHRPIIIDGKKYPSASVAIDDGRDPWHIMLLWVRDNRDVYMPYRHYNLSGTHSKHLQNAIRYLLMDRSEIDTSGLYVMLLAPREYPKVAILPSNMSIHVKRHVYALSATNTPNIWQQMGPIHSDDAYDMFLIDNTILYRHSQTLRGFLLLHSPTQDVSNTLSLLR